MIMPPGQATKGQDCHRKQIADEKDGEARRRFFKLSAWGEVEQSIGR